MNFLKILEMQFCLVVQILRILWCVDLAVYGVNNSWQYIDGTFDILTREADLSAQLVQEWSIPHMSSVQRYTAVILLQDMSSSAEPMSGYAYPIYPPSPYLRHNTNRIEQPVLLSRD